MYFYDYTVPVGWQDDTYGNDTCPSFVKLLEEYNMYLKLYAGYPDPKDRENPDAPRYALYLMSVWRNADPHSEFYDEPEPCELYDPPLLTAETLNEVMAFLKSEESDFKIEAFLETLIGEE